MSKADEQHLRRAIELAAEARAAGDMPFGSLLVGPGGEVLVEDRNTVVTSSDITAHPELKTALGSGPRGLRTLGRAVRGPQAARVAGPGHGRGDLPGPRAVRRGQGSDRRLLRLGAPATAGVDTAVPE
jgi:hypothetical protein